MRKLDLHYNLGGTNHSFAASTEICGNCHGDLDAVGVQASFDAQFQALANYIGSEAERALSDDSNIWIDEAEAGDVDSTSGFSLDASNIANVEFAGGDRLSFLITVTTPIPAGPWTAPVSAFEVQARHIFDVDGGTRTFADDANIMRANWNLRLFQNDSSHGIHNPGLTSEAIYATMLPSAPEKQRAPAPGGP